MTNRCAAIGSTPRAVTAGTITMARNTYAAEMVRPMPRMKHTTAPAIRMSTTLSPTRATRSRDRDSATPVAVRPPRIRPTPAMMPTICASVLPTSTPMSTHWRGPKVTLGLTRAISSRMATTQ